MPARHQSAGPRSASPTGRRLAGAGASAVAAVFAVAPLVHAGATPRPVTDSAAPADVDHSAASNRTVQAGPVVPNYGSQKVRIGVQVKDGSWVPDGTTTAGSVVTIVDTPPDGAPVTDTCETQASTAEPGSTATYCTFDNRALAAKAGGSVPIEQMYFLAPGHTLTLTQKSTASKALLLDDSTKTVGPCVIEVPNLRAADSAAPDLPTCSTDPAFATPEVFSDPGVGPDAQHDARTVKPGGSVTIQVLGNDTTEGAPATIKIVQKPAHGTAVVVNQASPALRGRNRAVAAAPAIRYTPDAGFFGHDSLRYSLTTANGTDTTTVSLRVAAPPTARDDSASTQAGDAVTVDVLANDARNGGGALSIDSVGDPGHGTAVIKDGHVVYTPADGFAGTDTFTYVARNSLGSDTATVTVTVSGVANTGTPSGELLGLAGLLLATGGAASVAGRRRYRARHAGGA